MPVHGQHESAMPRVRGRSCLGGLVVGIFAACNPLRLLPFQKRVLNFTLGSIDTQ